MKKHYYYAIYLYIAIMMCCVYVVREISIITSLCQRSQLYVTYMLYVINSFISSFFLL